LPPEIVPSTLKRTARSDAARPRAAPRSDGPKSGEDRQAYRRAPGQSSDKKADVGAGAADIELVSDKNGIPKNLNRQPSLSLFIFSAEDSVVAHALSKNSSIVNIV
jgi:hypothetical protein